MKQVGSRDNADNLAFFDHRNALDTVTFHYAHDVVQRGIDICRVYVTRHDVTLPNDSRQKGGGPKEDSADNGKKGRFASTVHEHRGTKK
jgi:hypothetical protein